MPAIAVPWPFGSVNPFEPSRIDVPATTLPSRSGCDPSTPVSRIATRAEPLGSTRTEDVVPADLGQGPLVAVGRVARLGVDLARPVGLDARDGRIRRAACRATPAGASPPGRRTPWMRRGAIYETSSAPAAARICDWVSADVPAAKRTRYSSVASAKLAENSAVAVLPARSVAVASKPALKPSGRSNDSVKDPSAATVTSAECSHVSSASSSTVSCTVSPAPQFSPLSATVSPGVYVSSSLSSVGSGPGSGVVDSARSR